MSIKESLERGPMDRQRTILERSTHNPYKEKLLDAGLLVHGEVGTPELLRALEEEIKPKFPDVKLIDPEVTVDGAVSLSIAWNFRADPDMHISLLQFLYNSIAIHAYPSTRHLLVRGEESELLDEREWRSDPKLVEDAIVFAYKKPAQILGPLVRQDIIR